MEKVVIASQIASCEQETLVCFKQVDKKWCVDTTIPKHYNRFLRQGWKLVREYVYDSGEIVGGFLRHQKSNYCSKCSEGIKIRVNNCKLFVN